MGIIWAGFGGILGYFGARNLKQKKCHFVENYGNLIVYVDFHNFVIMGLCLRFMCV
ncbi:hypothetical protein HBZC1_17920 [Helicobacter bizzozeronii CIII-1]|uniref:Uncharacterized protein n=1 Tax=Helicobacter bizzozeronii (strain CIII-1) TaxID=1002804 RepID=F8KPP5_HELBC|nr:hypothetical protein HBZC1_17920 [Helicobacter bizzozeronii CIII-1]